VENLLGKEITMRSDLSDGDRDKEADYQIIRDTQMPAILIEHLFFDQYEDAVLLFREDFIERFAEAQVRALLDFFAKTP
jgi:N-acetylmuramoyl-L-alanine amidase